MLNINVVKRWVEISTPEAVAEAIDIPSPAGSALCIASALKKDREPGKVNCFVYIFIYLLFFLPC